MQMNQVKQCIDRIEQCTDSAERALQGSSAPAELRQCVDEMHRQAQQAQQACSTQQQQSMDSGRIRETVERLEQTGDRAVKACRNAGSSVDPQLQQAVQRAHDEISSLKKQIRQMQ